MRVNPEALLAAALPTLNAHCARPIGISLFEFKATCTFLALFEKLQEQ